MTIESNRRQIEAKLGGEIKKRLAATGIVVQNNIKAEIREQELIDSGRMIGSITHEVGEAEVRIGTNINDPPYPRFLNNGTRYISPKHFMENGFVRSKAELTAIWDRKIG
jgi:HK97 gp10 family phage protein